MPYPPAFLIKKCLGIYSRSPSRCIMELGSRESGSQSWVLLCLVVEEDCWDLAGECYLPATGKSCWITETSWRLSSFWYTHGMSNGTARMASEKSLRSCSQTYEERKHQDPIQICSVHKKLITQMCTRELCDNCELISAEIWQRLWRKVM